MTLAIPLFLVPSARAGIKLITLPPRERVEIQLDNPYATLVEEERLVPLAKGINDVVFAWTHAGVRKDSIQLRPLADPAAVQVLSVSYPPNENALTWQVSAAEAGSARIRISYIMVGLDKSFTYRAVAANDEKTLTLRQFIQLHNRSREEFGITGMWAGFGERFERPIGIDETKQLLANKFTDVPVRKAYTADLSAFGYLDAGKKQLRIPMHYVLDNDADHALGRFPLMPGKARIFQQDRQRSSAFLGEDNAPFTPRDDEMRLYLGVAKDIVVKRTVERNKRVRLLGNLYNLDLIVKYEIENFKDKPVVLDIAESLPALRREVFRDTKRPVDWELADEGTLDDTLDKEKSTADKLVFHAQLPTRGPDQKAVKTVHKLHVLIKNEW
jgi:hypothetical protein